MRNDGLLERTWPGSWENLVGVLSGSGWASHCTALNLSFLSFWVLIRPESQVLPEADMKLEKVRTGTSWEAYVLEIKHMTDL